MGAYKGRGVVALDGVSLGNVPALTLSIAVIEYLRYSVTTTDPVPTLDSIAQVPGRVEVTMTITEYSAANLRTLTGGDGAGISEVVADLDQEYEITFDGVNCDSGYDFDFVGYRFVPLHSVALGIIDDGYSAAELTGILLADPSKTGAGISKYGKFTVAVA